MKIDKKVTETISIALSQAEVCAALAEYMSKRVGFRVPADKVILRRGDEGLYEATVEWTVANVKPAAKPKKAKAPAYPAAMGV